MSTLKRTFFQSSYRNTCMKLLCLRLTVKKYKQLTRNNHCLLNILNLLFEYLSSTKFWPVYQYLHMLKNAFNRFVTIIVMWKCVIYSDTFIHNNHVEKVYISYNLSTLKWPVYKKITQACLPYTRFIAQTRRQWNLWLPPKNDSPVSVHSRLIAKFCANCVKMPINLMWNHLSMIKSG